MKLIDRLKITIPFSYMWLLRRSLGNSKTILDLGCGDGFLMEVLTEGMSCKVVGVDLYEKNVKSASKKDIFIQVFKMDVIKFIRQQIRKGRKYDLVFCSQVIEHIERDKGERLLSLLDKVAKQRIIIGTPREFMEQHPSYLEGNPHQAHKSGWSEEDFWKRGYKVSGIGFSPFWSESGSIRVSSNKSVDSFFFVVSFLLSPIVYFIPKIAAGILCIKDIKK